MSPSTPASDPTVGQPPASGGPADQELLARAQQGDTQAFLDLYERHRRAVYRVAHGLTHDIEDAMDVVQETFIKAHKSIGRFERRAGIGTWLCQIAVHQAIDLCRKRKVRQSEPLDGVGREVAGRERSPDSHARERELSEAVGKALMKLSDKHRTVFVLHVVKGMPYKEIAETLGCSVGTVMSRLFYARRHLQGLLAPYAR